MSADADRADRPRLFGRRHGRRLRPGRRRLVETLLPRLGVAVPDGADPLDPRTLFRPPPADVWLEIGFGAGEHLAHQAATHPAVGFVGCEPFVTGVAGLLARVDEAGLDNVRIFDGDARVLLAGLAEASLGRVFALFPDPWPKARHHRRRLVGPETLDLLARAMKDDAEFRFASDDMGYVRWTLGHVGRHPAFAWTARRPADWRRRPAGGVETRYEAKARARGAACVHLVFRRRARGGAEAGKTLVPRAKPSI